MKLRVIWSLFPVLLAMLMISGAPKAQAADVRFSVGGGGHHEYRHNDFVTVDPGYTNWYPDTTSTYVYPDTVYSDTYVDPYVYSTPSVEFNSWYGGGYHNHDGVNFRGGYGGGRSFGGGHGGGGHGGRR